MQIEQERVVLPGVPERPDVVPGSRQVVAFERVEGHRVVRTREQEFPEQPPRRSRPRGGEQVHVAEDTRQRLRGPPKDRKNKASIVMVAGVSVRSLSGSTSVREPTNRTNRGRGDAISSRQTGRRVGKALETAGHGRRGGALVAAVVAHRGAEQATADADPDPAVFKTHCPGLLPRCRSRTSCTVRFRGATHDSSLLSWVPAFMELPVPRCFSWIPAFAGMTRSGFRHSLESGNPLFEFPPRQRRQVPWPWPALPEGIQH